MDTVLRVILLVFLLVNLTFGYESSTESTKDSLIKPLSHYKLKLKAKFNEKVVPTPAETYKVKKFELFETKEHGLDKSSTNVSWTKILSKKPKPKLKPTGIKEYATIKPLQINHDDTTSIDLNFKEMYYNYFNFSSNEDADDDQVVLDNLWKNITNDHKDKNVYKSIIDQHRLIVLPTTHISGRPSSNSTIDLNLGFDINDTGITKITTSRPIMPTVKKGEPSMFDEIYLDTDNKTGPRPTPMNKEVQEEMIGLFKKLIELKDPEKAAALKNEFLEQLHIDDSTKYKVNASMFDEPYSMPDSEETFEFRPTQRPKTDKELHELIKSLVERNNVNKTWLLSEFSKAEKSKSNTSITENNFTGSSALDNIYLKLTKPITEKEKYSSWNKTAKLFRIQPDIPRNKVSERPQPKIYLKEKQLLTNNYKSSSIPTWVIPIRTIPKQSKPYQGAEDEILSTEATIPNAQKQMDVGDGDNETESIYMVLPSNISIIHMNLTKEHYPNRTKVENGDNETESIYMVFPSNISVTHMNLTKEYYPKGAKVGDYWHNFDTASPTTLIFPDKDGKSKTTTTAKPADRFPKKEKPLALANNTISDKSNLLKDLENLYKTSIKMYPNRTCGIDNSPVNIVYEGSGKLDTYPWLGVLLYANEHKRVTSSVVLVTKEIVIGSAMDVYQLPKGDFREKARVVLGRSCDKQRLRVLDYNYHPEYQNGTYNALVIVQLDLTSAQHELRPICAPPAVLKEAIFHAMVLPEDCKSTKIKIYEMVRVSPEECKYYYRRSGLDIESLWPKHTACGRARWGGECVWRSGAVLSVKQNGRWHLLGFGVHGPGCEAPARFMDYGMYRRWVANSVARIGRPAVTRLGPNHLVLRRTSYKIQRFGTCDKGEVQHELFTDETRIGHKTPWMKSYGKARYNLTLFANSEYSCVIFKASYDPEFGISTKPKMFLRRLCPSKSSVCYTGGILQVDFYVEILFVLPLTFKVLAYGKEAKIVDVKTLSRYTNLKHKFPWPSQYFYTIPDCSKIPMCAIFDIPITIHVRHFYRHVSEYTLLADFKQRFPDIPFKIKQAPHQHNYYRDRCFYIQTSAYYFNALVANLSNWSWDTMMEFTWQIDQ